MSNDAERSTTASLTRAGARTSTIVLLAAATALSSCSRRGEDYPRDWPPLAWSWGCPKLAGQWRLGGQPGLDMGLLSDVPLVLVYGTHVAWDAIAISFDKNERMTIRLARSTLPNRDPDTALPSSLRPFATRLLGRHQSNEARATHYESHIDRDLYHCSGNKLTIQGWTTCDGAGSIYLSRDKAGGLVAGLVQRESASLVVNAGSPAVPLGHVMRYQYSHWPAITPAEFERVDSTAHVAEQLFDAGPLALGPAGPHDLEDARIEATAELEGGARLVALKAAGSGSVLATIEAPGERGIAMALGRVADARVFAADLRRYDPTGAEGVGADILLTPIGASGTRR